MEDNRMILDAIADLKSAIRELKEEIRADITGASMRIVS
jgi:hypothetical protein